MSCKGHIHNMTKNIFLAKYNHSSVRRLHKHWMYDTRVPGIIIHIVAVVFYLEENGHKFTLSEAPLTMLFNATLNSDFLKMLAL